MTKRKPSGAVQAPALAPDALSRAVEAVERQLTDDFDQRRRVQAFRIHEAWRSSKYGPLNLQEFVTICGEVGVDACLAFELMRLAYTAGMNVGDFTASTVRPRMHGQMARKVSGAPHFHAAAMVAWDALQATEKQSLALAHEALVRVPSIQMIAREKNIEFFTAQALSNWLHDTGRRRRRPRKVGG